MILSGQAVGYWRPLLRPVDIPTTLELSPNCTSSEPQTCYHPIKTSTNAVEHNYNAHIPRGGLPLFSVIVRRESFLVLMVSSNSPSL
jgi:hypothetical protein